ncbi:hypothetical protein CFC21_048667 [Triticum aestivum]|uniref:Uncharacterized protein n=4 Tax=Triticinae TaxID=1648030 RepID=A0A9R1K2G4_WHEAT|nr:hypothetical protein CFC21_048664 [Triticum aestivum]KAF7038489.1 hypothetical protein CFC21_048667 [Triticum aestivum]
MEYGHPCNSCSSNKEKRPPLKRGQLKLQIARTLGSLVVPGAKSSFSFRR